MKKILILLLAFLLALPVLHGLNYCSAVPEQFYGICEGPGDIFVYKEDGSLIARQFYSIDSGCYDGKYGITIIGGDNCLLQSGDTIVFKVNGAIVGAAVFTGDADSTRMDISDDRTYIIIDNDEDIKAIDEEGVDVSAHGSGGGGSSAITLAKPTDEGDVQLALFDWNSDENITIEAGTDDYAVYVNLPTGDAELLIPVNYNTGSVDICLGQTTFSGCDSVIRIAMGESKNGISVDSEYRIANGNRYYVVRGLRQGIVKETGSWFSGIIAIGLIVVAITILAVYLVLRRR